MKDSDLSDVLESEVSGELERLKKLPVSLLQALGHEGLTRIVKFGTHSYEIKAWSEPVALAPDSFVVLVGVLEPGSFSSTHLRGFWVRPDQPYADLPEGVLRSYDEP
jgi:hypothetical protein